MTPPAPNRRSSTIQESVTLAMAARANALRAAGQDVISLSAGEPDFPTPDSIRNAGIAAIEQHRYRYTAPSGYPKLREEGCRWMREAFGFDYAPDELMVTAGAKPALHMALNTIAEPGDRVLVLAPYWVSYPALVRMADAEPVIVPPSPDTGFLQPAEEIARIARQHEARGMILNFPNNPTGAVPSRDYMEQLVRMATELDLWLLSDEIYAMLTYEGRTHVSPAMVPGGRERTMVVTGFTKSHTLTGWRIGFLAGSADVVAAAGRIQSQLLGNPCTISQEAALAACHEPPFDEARRRLAEFDQRRRYVVDTVNALPGLSLAAPQGAFYALVDAREACAQLDCDDVGFCERLLEEQLLATVPGSAFGAPGFVRMSYAAAPDVLKNAMDRLRAFLTEHGVR
jgi:aspartate aminotransferase